MPIGQANEGNSSHKVIPSSGSVKFKMQSNLWLTPFVPSSMIRQAIMSYLKIDTFIWRHIKKNEMFMNKLKKITKIYEESHFKKN